MVRNWEPHPKIKSVSVMSIFDPRNVVGVVRGYRGVGDRTRLSSIVTPPITPNGQMCKGGKGFIKNCDLTRHRRSHTVMLTDSCLTFPPPNATEVFTLAGLAQGQVFQGKSVSPFDLSLVYEICLHLNLPIITNCPHRIFVAEQSPS